MSTTETTENTATLAPEKAAPHPFVHYPMGPKVPSETGHKHHRYFNRGHLGLSLGLYGGTADEVGGYQSETLCVVYRHAKADYADLDLKIRGRRHDCRLSASCTAQELREIAMRLLDAAHDLDINQASKLVAEGGAA